VSSKGTASKVAGPDPVNGCHKVLGRTPNHDIVRSIVVCLRAGGREPGVTTSGNRRIAECAAERALSRIGYTDIESIGGARFYAACPPRAAFTVRDTTIALAITSRYRPFMALRFAMNEILEPLRVWTVRMSG
jgi:hypothetical protein